jgi:hypothetical protein
MVLTRDEPMRFLSLAIDLLKREAMVEKFRAGPLNTGGRCTDYNMKRRIQYAYSKNLRLAEPGWWIARRSFFEDLHFVEPQALHTALVPERNRWVPAMVGSAVWR